MAIWPGTGFEGGVWGDSLDVFDPLHFQVVTAAAPQFWEIYDTIPHTGIRDARGFGRSFGGPGGIAYVNVLVTGGTKDHATIDFWVLGDVQGGAHPYVIVYNSALAEIMNLTYGAGATTIKIEGSVETDTGCGWELATWTHIQIDLYSDHFYVNLWKAVGFPPLTYNSPSCQYEGGLLFDFLTRFRFQVRMDVATWDDIFIDDIVLDEPPPPPAPAGPANQSGTAGLFYDNPDWTITSSIAEVEGGDRMLSFFTPEKDWAIGFNDTKWTTPENPKAHSTNPDTQPERIAPQEHEIAPYNPYSEPEVVGPDFRIEDVPEPQVDSTALESLGDAEAVQIIKRIKTRNILDKR